MPLPAGLYQYRVDFERREKGRKDGAGNTRGDWLPLLSCWAAFRPQFGREAIASGRIESTMLGVITVRRWTDTAAIVASDRMIFKTGPYAGSICNIRAILPTPDGAEIEMTIEAGALT